MILLTVLCLKVLFSTSSGSRNEYSGCNSELIMQNVTKTTHDLEDNASASKPRLLLRREDGDFFVCLNQPRQAIIEVLCRMADNTKTEADEFPANSSSDIELMTTPAVCTGNESCISECSKHRWNLVISQQKACSLVRCYFHGNESEKIVSEKQARSHDKWKTTYETAVEKTEDYDDPSLSSPSIDPEASQQYMFKQKERHSSKEKFEMPYNSSDTSGFRPSLGGRYEADDITRQGAKVIDRKSFHLVGVEEELSLEDELSGKSSPKLISTTVSIIAFSGISDKPGLQKQTDSDVELANDNIKLLDNEEPGESGESHDENSYHETHNNELPRIPDIREEHVIIEITDIGYITSPDYPDPYLNGVNISWSLFSPDNYPINLQLTDFYTEKDVDILYIYIASETNRTLLAAISGDLTERHRRVARDIRIGQTHVIPSNSTHLYLEFLSDYHRSYSGFNITYSLAIPSPKYERSTMNSYLGHVDGYVVAIGTVIGIICLVLIGAILLYYMKHKEDPDSPIFRRDNRIHPVNMGNNQGMSRHVYSIPNEVEMQNFLNQIRHPPMRTSRGMYIEDCVPAYWPDRKTAWTEGQRLKTRRSDSILTMNRFNVQSGNYHETKRGAVNNERRRYSVATTGTYDTNPSNIHTKASSEQTTENAEWAVTCNGLGNSNEEIKKLNERNDSKGKSRKRSQSLFTHPEELEEHRWTPFGRLKVSSDKSNIIRKGVSCGRETESDMFCRRGTTESLQSASDSAVLTPVEDISIKPDDSENDDDFSHQTEIITRGRIETQQSVVEQIVNPNPGNRCLRGNQTNLGKGVIVGVSVVDGKSIKTIGSSHERKMVNALIQQEPVARQNATLADPLLSHCSPSKATNKRINKGHQSVEDKPQIAHNSNMMFVNPSFEASEISHYSSAEELAQFHITSPTTKQPTKNHSVKTSRNAKSVSKVPMSTTTNNRDADNVDSQPADNIIAFREFIRPGDKAPIYCQQSPRGQRSNEELQCSEMKRISEHENIKSKSFPLLKMVELNDSACKTDTNNKGNILMVTGIKKEETEIENSFVRGADVSRILDKRPHDQIMRATYTIQAEADDMKRSKVSMKSVACSPIPDPVQYQSRGTCSSPALPSPKFTSAACSPITSSLINDTTFNLHDDSSNSTASIDTCFGSFEDKSRSISRPSSHSSMRHEGRNNKSGEGHGDIEEHETQEMHIKSPSHETFSFHSKTGSSNSSTSFEEIYETDAATTNYSYRYTVSDMENNGVTTNNGIDAKESIDHYFDESSYSDDMYSSDFDTDDEYTYSDYDSRDETSYGDDEKKINGATENPIHSQLRIARAGDGKRRKLFKNKFHPSRAKEEEQTRSSRDRCGRNFQLTGDLARTIAGVSLPNPAPPKEFICPITGHVMSDPVFATNKKRYEREAIMGWFLEHTTWPGTSVSIVDTKLQTDYVLAARIRDWKSKKNQKRMKVRREIRKTAASFLSNVDN